MTSFGLSLPKPKSGITCAYEVQDDSETLICMCICLYICIYMYDYITGCVSLIHIYVFSRNPLIYLEEGRVNQLSRQLVCRLETDSSGSEPKLDFSCFKDTTIY